MKQMLWILGFLSLGPIEYTFSQSNPVEITYTNNTDRKEYTFQYQNNSYFDYAVKVEFASLQGGTCTCSLPFVGTVSAGKGNLFTLKPLQANQGISFRFSYKYQKGRLLSKPPKPNVYLFPFSKTKAHRANQTQNILELIAGKKITDFYGMSFQMEKGDTIFAARRGIVSEIKNEFDTHPESVWFSSNTNFVEVFHQDGTFGKYNRFKKGTIMVKAGQSVEAGQPIGIVADDTFEGNTLMQLTVYYLDRAKAFTDAGHSFTYVIPAFYSTNAPAGIMLQQGALYTSDFPESIVTQEMTKRELKKWKEMKQ
jgi:murein DD-endopeptidase MepM/ murein hydrolase activator NlpD